jgi:hypothetical protein
VGEHKRAVSLDRLAERKPVDPGDERLSCARRTSSGMLRQSSPSNCRRSNAMKPALSAPRLVLSAAKSLWPSGRMTTASPSSKTRSTGKDRTASAIREKVAL